MQLFNNDKERVIQDQLLTLISQSTRSLKIAVTWFTNHELFNAVLQKLALPRFTVELIVLNDRINNKKEGLDFQELIDRNGIFYYSGIDNMVHHKFCVIDDGIVVTGSYNWTYYAEQRNWENVVVIKDPGIVAGYTQEFDSVVQQHQKISNIQVAKRMDTSFVSNEYLETDYSFQAERELRKGNDIAAAKVYTEILKINNNHEAVKEERNTVVARVNQQQFEVCPFEIGILYSTGYEKAIPAFSQLPLQAIKTGSTPNDTTTILKITVQKYDYTYTLLHEFCIKDIKPCPANTVKVEVTLFVGCNGILTLSSRELNGYGKVTLPYHIDLKKHL